MGLLHEGRFLDVTIPFEAVKNLVSLESESF